MIETMMDVFNTSLLQAPLLAILAAFIIGILYTLSPCTFTMVPVVIGYVGGYSGDTKKSRIKGFFYSLYFVLGNAIVLAILGATLSYVGGFLGKQSSLWNFLFIGVILIMGLHLLGIIKLKIPTFAINHKPTKRGALGAFLLGGMMGIATSPCSTPILTAVLAFVAMGSDPIYGGILLFVYALGKGLILIGIGTFTGIVKYDEKMANWSTKVEKASGIILIIVAIKFLLDRL